MKSKNDSSAQKNQLKNSEFSVASSSYYKKRSNVSREIQRHGSEDTRETPANGTNTDGTPPTRTRLEKTSSRSRRVQRTRLTRPTP